MRLFTAHQILGQLNELQATVELWDSTPKELKDLTKDFVKYTNQIIGRELMTTDMED